MNSYEGGLAQQSTKHFYAGATSTPKRQSCKKGSKVSCKKKSIKPKK